MHDELLLHPQQVIATFWDSGRTITQVAEASGPRWWHIKDVARGRRRSAEYVTAVARNISS